MGGTLREGYFTSDTERYAKVLEMDVCFHWGPAFGEQGGTILS
jgi:hypothetical protein